ncbi:UDP-galactopyranose mutase [Leptospira gomenensis]|uniref:UDP-galactopyranose mutase n=1 Tax=Leptospira gomenensis TaxID=2484974 RepID=A0A5F1Y857_9LEPT|nr:UDP-galactopyranose mutase [Leptospira gomenensis]TGK32564.1 UDP-galactopyranose mutase [Leptospira gomenensis]TGK45427.1 UDP-galactopyranose mutase [Leptospira gomenensis]TGK60649.1 UDP-galactopyranose mutase [Leptospira gomenensis]
MNVLIVGAGFSGAVVAHELASALKDSVKITVLDQRDHIGGNCHTERDGDTGVMVHKYGPHIFHTDDVETWNYVNSFVKFIPFVNRVKAKYGDRVYSLPVNLHTINQLFEKSLNPSEARRFVEEQADSSIQEPANFEEQALKFLGERLYKAFFFGYTKKQWGCDPKELPASILKRLPVRFSYDDNYYNDPYQGIPESGYTEIVLRMLDHSNIQVLLNTKFDPGGRGIDFDHTFYTGPIDEYFGYRFGRLGYRTVFFEKGTGEGDFQGNAVINYCDESVPWTRIHEHKHFAPWEKHEKTVWFKEFSKETDVSDVPYYPKRLDADMERLQKYQDILMKETKVTFLGRLATYRYMDMHHVIREAREVAARFLSDIKPS